MVGVQVYEWYNVGDEAGNVRHIVGIIRIETGVHLQYIKSVWYMGD